MRLATFSTVGTVASAGKRREEKESGVTHRLEVHNEPDNEMLFMIRAGVYPSRVGEKQEQAQEHTVCIGHINIYRVH